MKNNPEKYRSERANELMLFSRTLAKHLKEEACNIKPVEKAYLDCKTNKPGGNKNQCACADEVCHPRQLKAATRADAKLPAEGSYRSEATSVAVTDRMAVQPVNPQLLSASRAASLP